MNVLGLIFSLLLILSYGFYACWDKQTASSRLRSTYVGHQKANRKLLNKYQSEIYDGLRGKGERTEPRQRSESEGRAQKAPELNRECSKINLWPLIDEGRDKHPVLYETAAKLFRTFYPSLAGQEKRFEYRLLDALIQAAKETEPFALEKVSFHEPKFQRIYYKMLKGTKHWDLASGKGLPPLLDYLKAEPAKDKICLFHAHPDLIAVFFGPKVAVNLYAEIHREDGPLLTTELIEKFCSEAHMISVDPALFELLELGKPDHKEVKKTLIAEDRNSDVYLRKSVYLKG